MKTIGYFAFIALIYTNNAVGQELDSHEKIEIPTFESQDHFTLSPQENCGNRADRDIEKEEPKLIICFSFEGSIERGREAFYSNQQAFEEKYGIVYKLYDCTAENEECVKKYNKRVLKHLQTNFGRKWKKEIRKDVYGL